MHAGLFIGQVAAALEVYPVLLGGNAVEKGAGERGRGPGVDRGVHDEDRPALSVSTRSRGENSDKYQEDISHEEFVRGLVREYAITPQEERVLELVMLGKSNSEIANLLGIAEKTARNHVSSLYQKTETRNRVELVQVFELVQMGRTIR